MKTLTALLLTLTAGSLAADEFSRWTWRNPTPLGVTLFAVVHAADRFVAVGSAGNILTSEDGREWSIASSSTTARFLGVNHGNGLFVAYGQQANPAGNPSYTAGLAWSPDGLNWHLPTHNLPFSIRGMAFGTNTWVLVDAFGNLRSATDLTDWTLRIGSVLSAFSDVIFAQEKFVAIGSRGVIMTSTNGIDWAHQDSGTTAGLSDISYCNGRFVAVGNSDEKAGAGIILTSLDAEDWLIQFTDFPLSGVDCGPYGFTAVGGTGFGFSCGQSLNSNDGLYFEPGPAGCDSGLTSTPNDVACNDDVCVGVGFSGGIWVTDDGLTWEGQQQGTVMTLFAAAAGTDRLVVAGQLDTVTISTNGRTFVEQAIPGNWRGAGSDGTSFVLVGEKGALAESVDGQEWSLPLSPVITDLRSVVHGPAGWLAGGAGGTTIIRQPDGTWGAGTVLGRSISQVHYSERLGVYLAIGDLGLFAASSNRIDWAFGALGTTKYLAGLAESPERLLVVTQDRVFTSTDGVTWTGHPLDSGSWTGAYYANGLFIVLGRNQRNLLTSTDGSMWENRSVGTDLVLGAAYFQGSFYVVGNGGMILQSASASVPKFLSITPGGGSLDFELFGEIGREYELQSSGKLTDWEHEQDYTQSARQHPLTLPTGPDQRFYRVKLKE